jgi:hypothetical protein
MPQHCHLPARKTRPDLDGDGRLDALWGNELGDKTLVWCKNGGGSPPTWLRYTISSTEAGLHGVFAADMDGDGRVDVLSASVDDDQVTWYKNGGESPPSWARKIISSTADFAFFVYVHDVNSDGRLDVVSASFNDDKVSVYLNGMCPPGTFGPGGNTPCSPCVPGRYGIDSLQAYCPLCPEG